MRVETLLLVLAVLEPALSYTVHINLPKINETNVNITTHLKYPHIQRMCANRGVCVSNNTRVCAVREGGGGFEHRDFENWCFLFFSNMCDYPGHEYSIVQAGSCRDYLSTRRMYVYSGVDVATAPPTTAPPDNTTAGNGTATTKAGRGALRMATFSTLYDVETAFDDHICPMDCSDVYMPVCLSANRGHGKYFKMWTFVNHCKGDLYYCKNWEEFSPPEGESEKVHSSPLAWSYCGAHRYLQFARFAESTSAMGHYGWLEGPYKHTHIMEPHERRPGYG